MLSFECDYIKGAHPAVLQALVETNMEIMSGYGADPYTERAKEKIRHACGNEAVQVELLVGGTQTNALAISTLLQGHQGVISARTGHIGVHEAGAIEFTGSKVLTLPSHQGKLCPREVRDYLETFYGDVTRDHMVFPGMLYISYPTELGTLYTKEELTELYDLCRQYEMTFYIDGARLGYGLASPGCDLTLPELCTLCDVFYIGGTKVGALCGEALVFTHGNEPPHFMTLIKKRGALLAKGRLLGVQFDALFTDDLYFRISAHAIEMARKMKEIFKEKGYTFWLESPTNQQFLILEDATKARLEKNVRFDFWEKADPTHTVVRFATSWSTTEEELAALRALL